MHEALTEKKIYISISKFNDVITLLFSFILVKHRL